MSAIRLAGLEAGEGDSSEFLKWQNEMKQMDAAEEKAENERKHLVSFANIVVATDPQVP